MHVKSGPQWDFTAAPTFWINHASRGIMKRFEERLRPHDLGMAYLPVIVSLYEDGPLSQRELLERARIEQPTMAALLARMERDGLIVRKPDPSDARSRVISLSAKGRARLPIVMEAMQEVVDQALAGIDAGERAMLMDVLQRVVKNLA